MITSEVMSTSLQQARYSAGNPTTVADGWRLERLTAPSRLFGANGLRTGPDGRVYVAQVTGSQISALDLETGGSTPSAPRAATSSRPTTSPSTPSGNLYATEVMDGRVSVRDTGGRTRVLRDDLPCANGITVHQGRLFINECRDGGRLMELDRTAAPPRDPAGEPAVAQRDGGRPRRAAVLPGDDRQRDLANRSRQRRREPQRVAGDLGVPDAVKFDADGYIVSTQVASGQVLRIDPRSGEQTAAGPADPGPGQPAPSSATGCSSRTSPARSPRSSAAAKRAPCCRAG